MSEIDMAIITTDQAICKNIEVLKNDNSGLLAQNILSHLRNFIEYIIQKVKCGENADPNDYSQKNWANNSIKKDGQYEFIWGFHELLQKSASHYTLDENASERLLLKYLDYLINIRAFMQYQYSMNLLYNLESIIVDNDSKLLEYYNRIVERIIYSNPTAIYSQYSDRYYIIKQKPLFINGRVYYEITYTAASENVSKFDCMIAFTNHKIVCNYAVTMVVRYDTIMMGKHILPIQIIENWFPSIRPCELNNFARIIGVELSISSTHTEYRELMQFIFDSKWNILSIATSEQNDYLEIKRKIAAKARAMKFFSVLDKVRSIICNNRPGANVLRYLLLNLNNRVIRAQYNSRPNNLLSYLCLDNACIPFDTMPYATSLISHNPRIADLIDSIDGEGRNHEFLARAVKINTLNKAQLFTPKLEVEKYGNVEVLINTFNSKLYYSDLQQSRRIKVFADHLYIVRDAEDTSVIMEKLSELSSTGIANYIPDVEHWLKNNPAEIDCDEKKEAIKYIFSKSHVSLVYGAAGTGKTRFIRHISSLYKSKKRLYLAHTNPAVENLKRNIGEDINTVFSTTTKYINSYSLQYKYDLIFIDECSTVCNSDMRKIVDNSQFDMLVLVGDEYQIEAIEFGNWFGIARHFVPKTSVLELTTPFRNNSDHLKIVWDRVRLMTNGVEEAMLKYGYISDIDDSIFVKKCNDEIILCLNYDGLYGINNINRFLQSDNPSPPFEWGTNIYKVGDPILFNEIRRFEPYIYNNTKGTITKIERNDNEIWFEIELDSNIGSLSENINYGFKYIGLSSNNKQTIRFKVDKRKSSDEDHYNDILSEVPFQIAYAVSIHKAQGLEYSSVKIIITDEVEEQITHNVFYTAITRARDYLKVYWSKKTQKKILSSLVHNDSKKDGNLLKQLMRNKSLD